MDHEYNEEKYPLTIKRSVFAAGKWLLYPIVLAVSSVAMSMGLFATGAMFYLFTVIISLLFFIVSGLLIYVSARDWSDEYYMVDPINNIVLIRYRTMGKYDTQRKGPLSDLSDAWYVKRGLWGLVFDVGSVYLQVGWSRQPFEMRDVWRPAVMTQEIINAAELVDTEYIEESAVALGAEEEYW